MFLECGSISYLSPHVVSVQTGTEYNSKCKTDEPSFQTIIMLKSVQYFLVCPATLERFYKYFVHDAQSTSHCAKRHIAR